MTTQLNWKTLTPKWRGGVLTGDGKIYWDRSFSEHAERNDVLIAFDEASERIRVSFPVHFSLSDIKNLIESNGHACGQLEDIKPGPLKGEMIASFTYPE